MAIGIINLSDATPGTPAVHSFTPIASGRKAEFVNMAGALTVRGQETLTLEVIRAKTDNAENSARAVLVLPQEATADGVTTRVGEVSISLSVRATKSIPKQAVLNALAMMSDFTSENVVKGAIGDFVPLI